MTIAYGSTRIDLLGGTLDLKPINFILPNVVTLNFATSLKAKVEIKKNVQSKIIFNSLDYNTTAEFNLRDFTKKNIDNNYFGDFSFLAMILHLVNIKEGLEIILSSKAPPGAGLGGSSAMGITFFSALSKHINKQYDRAQTINKINDVEAKLLNSGPAGYQDYYPALYGGILALIPEFGCIKVEQLFNEKLKKCIEERVTLVFTGKNRFSGINNWEVYKAFFDKEKIVVDGLKKIAQLSYDAYNSIKEEDYSCFIELIGKEGDERKKLFPKIVIPEQEKLLNNIRKDIPNASMKVCGAGGGGCFIITHGKNDSDVVKKHVENENMIKLDFYIDAPINRNV